MPASKLPMIGASAAISGTMAAAMRFAFQRGGPLGFWRSGERRRLSRAGDSACAACCAIRACSRSWSCGSASILLFGLGSMPLAGEDQAVAWQAHIGGFLAGLLLFSWFDPTPESAAIRRI